MMELVDVVVKALADPTRRSLLDELFGGDCQTLSELEERFEMTRFGVMKHLKQLEEAGLVVTKRRGRAKFHFLNPIALVASGDGIPAGVETGIRLISHDVDADHAALRANGIDADEILRWPGVPPMFAFRDQDGNGLEIVGEAGP